MDQIKHKEIVVETECVRLVQKRARTHPMFCERCWREADFLLAKDAARVFSLGAERFRRFIDGNGWHLTTLDGNLFICAVSLIANLRRNDQPAKVRLIT